MMPNQSRTSQKSCQQNQDTIATATTYRGFLVRLWKDGDGALWRSSARSVRTGETVRFASLTELFTFLESQTNGPPEEEKEERVGWRTPYS